MTGAVDHVVLIGVDDEQYPPEKVIRVYGHPPTEHDKADGVSFQVCEYDETADASAYTVLGEFHIPVDQLLKSLELVLDCELTLVRETP